MLTDMRGVQLKEGQRVMVVLQPGEEMEGKVIQASGLITAAEGQGAGVFKVDVIIPYHIQVPVNSPVRAIPHLFVVEQPADGKEEPVPEKRPSKE